MVIPVYTMLVSNLHVKPKVIRANVKRAWGAWTFIEITGQIMT